MVGEEAERVGGVGMEAEEMLSPTPAGAKPCGSPLISPVTRLAAEFTELFSRLPAKDAAGECRASSSLTMPSRVTDWEEVREVVMRRRVGEGLASPASCRRPCCCWASLGGAAGASTTLTMAMEDKGRPLAEDTAVR
jgi:hypothetical protein